MVAVLSVLAVSFLASLASAQTPPACALTCANNAIAGSGCKDISDLKCLCNSEAFFDAAGICVLQTCSPADVQAAQNTLASLCKGSATTTFSLDTSTLSQTGGGGGSSSGSPSSTDSGALTTSTQSSQSTQSGVSKTSTQSSVSGQSTGSRTSTQSTNSATSGVSQSNTSSAAPSSTSGAAGKRAVVFGAGAGSAAVALVGMVVGAAVAF